MPLGEDEEDLIPLNPLNHLDAADMTDCQKTSFQTPNKLATTSNLIKLNLFWFGYQFTWFLITIIILPSQVDKIANQGEKGKWNLYIEKEIIYAKMTIIIGLRLWIGNDKSNFRNPLSLFLSSIWSHQ